jgi:hypothetical protein
MMDAATVALHRSLIRCLKTVIAAWEKWLSEKAGTDGR